MTSAPASPLRGSASTGFRAPSLQQAYFTSTVSVVQTPPILETGSYPATIEIARALGARDLEPEKSANFSLGDVFRSGGFSFTADAYQITIRDQLALSENIAASFSPQVAAILAPFGVQAARFCINGIKSPTRGLDLVASYRMRARIWGRSLSALPPTSTISTCCGCPIQPPLRIPCPTLVRAQPDPDAGGRHAGHQGCRFGGLGARAGRNYRALPTTSACCSPIRPGRPTFVATSLVALAASLYAVPALAQDAGREPNIIVTGERSTLTVPDTTEATANIQRTPGAVEIVPDTAFKNTPAQHIKDILGYVPGVVTQTRMGDDARARSGVRALRVLMALAGSCSCSTVYR